MSTFGAANPSAGPSIMDRVPPMPSMVAMVRNIKYSFINILIYVIYNICDDVDFF